MLFDVYTDYSYDSVDRMSTVTQDLVNVAYSYASGNLSLIKRSYTNGDCDQNYSFTYNKYGQRLTVAVGNRLLAAYSYDTTTHNLSDMTYGNEASGSISYRYTYDRFDRLVAKTKDNAGEITQYMYDYLGNVIQETHLGTSGAIRADHYAYDRLGRLTASYTTENGVIVEQKESTFDAKGRDLKYGAHKERLVC